MLVEEDACARCGRLTPVDALLLWTRKERVREFTPRAAPAKAAALQPVMTAEGSPMPDAPPPPVTARQPAIRYRHITRAHAVCPACHALVSVDEARFHDHDQRRAWVVAIAFAGLAALLWLGFAPFSSHWIAAFWRNGAGGP